MDHGTLPADWTEIIADGIGINAVTAEDLRIFFPQISGETYTLKLHVECPLDDRFIGERRKNFIRDTVAVRQIVELHCTVIYRNAHQRDSKIRRIGVSVHTTLGDVTVTPSLQIDFYCFHGNTSLNPPGRNSVSRPPDIHWLIKRGNRRRHRWRNHPLHGSCRREAHRRGASGGRCAGGAV